MRTGELALEGNVFLVEGEKYAIRERKKVNGDFKPLLMNFDERVKRSELGCG